MTNFQLNPKLYKTKTAKVVISDSLKNQDKSYGLITKQKHGFWSSSSSNEISRTAEYAVMRVRDLEVNLNLDGKYPGKLHEFFQAMDMTFHPSIHSPDLQLQKRMDFCGWVFEMYFSTRFHKDFGNGLGPYMQQFISDKNLANRQKLKKFPIACTLEAVDTTIHPTDIVQYLMDSFSYGDYTFTVANTAAQSRYANIKAAVNVGFSDKTQFNLLNLSMPKFVVVEKIADFASFTDYMDQVEHIIETKFLK